MTRPAIAPIPHGGAGLDRLLALNNAHARETSPLSAAALEALIGQCFAALGAGPEGADGFLLALDHEADYDSPHFLWARARLARFIYVDRVIVAPERRGQGVARALYARLEDAARAASHAQIVCEVNRVPPNPVSDAVHAALGFAEIGRARLDGGAKAVRYLAKALSGHRD